MTGTTGAPRRRSGASLRPLLALSLGVALLLGVAAVAVAPAPVRADASGDRVHPLATTGPGQGNNSSGPPGITYSVSFFASGLPGGTTWGVLLNGTSMSSRSNEITFPAVTTGRAAYTILTPGDYSAQPASGQITVSGAERVAIVFSGGPPVSTSPIQPVELELIGIIGGLGALAVVLLELRERRRLRRESTPPAP
ncbi:MAG: hypothetical protein ACREC5_04050 [Thermoplasmata archaeon]